MTRSRMLWLSILAAALLGTTFLAILLVPKSASVRIDSGQVVPPVGAALAQPESIGSVLQLSRPDGFSLPDPLPVPEELLAICNPDAGSLNYTFVFLGHTDAAAIGRDILNFSWFIVPERFGSFDAVLVNSPTYGTHRFWTGKCTQQYDILRAAKELKAQPTFLAGHTAYFLPPDPDARFRDRDRVRFISYEHGLLSITDMAQAKEVPKGWAEDPLATRALTRNRLVRLLSGYGVVQYGRSSFGSPFLAPFASASVYPAGGPFSPDSRLWTVAVCAEATAGDAARRAAKLQYELRHPVTKQSDPGRAARDQETVIWSEDDLVWSRTDEAQARRRLKEAK